MFCIEMKEEGSGNYVNLYIGTSCDNFHRATTLKNALKFYDRDSAERFMQTFGGKWSESYGITDHVQTEK